MDSEVPAKLELQNSNSQASASPAGQRKERGAIAAQACDTCRSRKQKCDEQRPKCGTCQRFKLECHYREPQPTKKDKTLVEILDRIKSLEGKIDSLKLQDKPSTLQSTLLESTPLRPSTASTTAVPVSPFIPPPQSTDSPSSTAGSTYSYVSSVHQMLGWPGVQRVFQGIAMRIPDFNPASIAQEGPAFVLGLNDGFGPLPLSTPEPSMTHRSHSMSLPGHRAGPPNEAHGLSTLDYDSVQRLSTAYFEFFNLLYPILDRQTFLSAVLPAVLTDDLGAGIFSTLAYLVLALGEVAIAAIKGNPVGVYNGRRSGVKGGSPTQPPGLTLFNEARRRMGFNLTDCSLENVQIFALAGLYYGSCCHHMEFWRMTTSASLAIQALLSSNPAELTSPRADLIRRIFWHCSITETALHMELGLPLTGLDKYENLVKVPDFSGNYSGDDYVGHQTMRFGEHFASQILLRRLVVDFHGVLSSGSPSSSPFTPSSTSSQPDSSVPATIKPMALQLDEFRSKILPAHLRWEDGERGAFSIPKHEMYGQGAFPSSSLSVPDPTTQYMFTTDLDSDPTSYPYNEDVQVAMLRTRYYYVKYLIHRPFLYKALHYPDQMTQEEAEGAAECLKACLKWPVTMSPTCTHKRLIPCLFFWTQNMLGVLVILHLSRQVSILSKIRSNLCGDRFEVEASETVGLALDWIRDLKVVDPAAKWAWEIVRAVYGLEE